MMADRTNYIPHEYDQDIVERGEYAEKRMVGVVGRFLLQPVHALGRFHGTR